MEFSNPKRSTLNPKPLNPKGLSYGIFFLATFDTCALCLNCVLARARLCVCMRGCMRGWVFSFFKNKNKHKNRSRATIPVKMTVFCENCKNVKRRPRRYLIVYNFLFFFLVPFWNIYYVVVCRMREMQEREAKAQQFSSFFIFIFIFIFIFVFSQA